MLVCSLSAKSRNSLTLGEIYITAIETGKYSMMQSFGLFPQARQGLKKFIVIFQAKKMHTGLKYLPEVAW